MGLLVIGNAAVDRCYVVDALPGVGESVLAERGTSGPGGKGLNQAVMAARAGVNVALVTVVGDDAAGRSIRALVAAESIDSSFVRVVAGPTDESVVVVDRAGANQILTTTAAVRALGSRDVERATGVCSRGGWLLLQGNLTLEATAQAIGAALAAGLHVAFNPSPLDPRHAGLLERADVVVVNEPEAAALDLTRARAAIVTRGAAGVRLTVDGSAEDIPAVSTVARDTTGAGDVFCGVLVARLARGTSLLEAARAGAAAASLKVGRRGTLDAFPTRGELHELLA